MAACEMHVCRTAEVGEPLGIEVVGSAVACLGVLAFSRRPQDSSTGVLISCEVGTSTSECNVANCEHLMLLPALRYGGNINMPLESERPDSDDEPLQLLHSLP